MPRRLALLLTGVLVLAACGSSGPGGSALAGGLVRAGDLPDPSSWTAYQARIPPPPKGPGICGTVPHQDGPARTDVAAVAWARDPDDGPIVGERLERYGSPAQAAAAFAARPAPHGCDWTNETGSWRAQTVDPMAFGDQSGVVLITNRDRPDAFSFEISIRSGDALLLAVVSQRTTDRTLVDDVVAGMWRRATAAGIVGP